MVLNSQPAAYAESFSNTRVRTLVVHDSPIMLKILAQILENAGFDLVGTATNGFQALRSVAMLSPDLVLMDLHLSLLSGTQAVQCIKRRQHPPVIIAVGSDCSAAAKTTAQLAGADEFVSDQCNLRQCMTKAFERFFGRTRRSRVDQKFLGSAQRPIAHCPRRVQHNSLRSTSQLERSRSSALPSRSVTRRHSLPLHQQ